ncbi:MAG: 4Fe-4S dicluster domain-containing protein [Anaerofustis stercorihominis]|nr:4Fe-4S dicluster domain-containing protein [Anaerofustis stercorihominis]
MTLPENKVTQLIDLMNSVSTAVIPAQKPIIELFNIAMDEKTVDYLLKLGKECYKVEELKTIYHELFGGNDEDWNDFWTNRLMKYSFLHPVSETQRDVYQILSIFPGWVEFAVSGPLNEERAAMINKFMEFWGILKEKNTFLLRTLSNYKNMKALKNGAPPKVSTLAARGREVSLNRELTTTQEVLTAGDVYRILEKNKDEIAVMNCFCRTYKKMSKDEDCGLGLPIEGCLSVGAISRQLVANGVARHLPYEEACAMMDEFEEKGCIHTTFHYENNANNDELVICNCCPDCCLLYSGYREGAISKVHNRAYYSPKMIDETRCTGCNRCAKYCPTEATYYDKAKKKLVFHYEKCIGCGQCVNQCRFDVREMVPDRRDVFVKTKKPVK